MMRVITCHVNTDFDAFSSMIAASKIYNDAVMVFPGSVSKDVSKFLVMYRGIFDIKRIHDINIDEVEELIIVDTNSKTRIGDFAKIIDNPSLTKIVYDHHPTVDTMINASDAVIEEVGSNTTIMVNELIRKNIDISSIEATIFTIGIYADTNCLTFSSTKASDAKVVAYLLEKGAKLDVVNSFMEHRMSKEQDKLFLDLINAIKVIELDNYVIGISKIDMNDYVNDVAFITRKILEVRGYDAMFSVVKMENKVYVVARSKSDSINVGNIMRELGGAGHPRAASSRIKGGDVEEISKKLVDIIKQNVKPNMTANDIMTYPVKTVSGSTKIREVNEMILRYGHTGFPVVDDDKLIGIIARRDIEKAILHKLEDSPVKAYMSKNVITIDKNMPVEEIQESFVENNIGRVPVIEDGNIVGVVTRTDLLKNTYGNDNISYHKETQSKSLIIQNETGTPAGIIEKLYSIDYNIRDILLKAGDIGDNLEYKVCVVGGFVRDLIIGINNLDIDILVEGDGVEFAKAFATVLGGKLTVHEEFKTAVINLNENFHIDVVTARAEYYKYPGALPTVQQGSIFDDMSRRDFTINSIAIVLNKNNFGEVIDFFNGIKDLQNGKIRILHKLSFLEDSTRIFRAIRFEQRYSFRLEEETLKFAKEAIQNGNLETLSWERIWFEIEAIIKENKCENILSRMNEFGLFKFVFKSNFTEVKYKFIEEYSKISTEYIHKYKLKIDRSTEIYTMLFSDLDFNKFNIYKKNIKLSKNYISSIENCLFNLEEVSAYLRRGVFKDNYSLYKIINRLTDSSLAILLYLMKNDDIILSKLQDYIINLRNIKVLISGHDVIALGVKQGPQFKEIFENLLKLKVNNKVKTKEEEINAIKNMI